MAYSAPTVGAAGLTIPTYSDILSNLIAKYLNIYGQQVYLGVDSKDYEFISTVSLAINDAFQAILLAYNARSPLTAVGSDLDSVVKLNGLTRKSASASTASVTVTGTVGAVITNGICKDLNGNLWDLPSTVTIPVGGTIVVTATCETLGMVNAAANTITGIATPQAGWVSVTNAAAATPGQAVEADSALRARQALSVALPSQTMVGGTVAGIAATPGVTRWNVAENPTGSTDSNGNPPHSITCVVEGGTTLAVATSIYNNRGIGCATNGTTSQVVTDSYTGQPFTVNFSRPTYVAIYVSLNVHELTGYTTSTTTAIQTAIAAYLNTLQIGQSVVLSELYGAALGVRPNPDAPMFSIRALTLGTSPSPSGTSDITVAFDHVAQGIAANVVITIV